MSSRRSSPVREAALLAVVFGLKMLSRTERILVRITAGKTAQSAENAAGRDRARGQAKSSRTWRSVLIAGTSAATVVSGAGFLFLYRLFRRKPRLKPPLLAPAWFPVQPVSAPVASRQRTGRAADRFLGPKNGGHRWGTLVTAFALGCAIAAGVGFLFIYWSDGSNFLLGGTLALFFGDIGCALVLQAQWLMPHKIATEPREPLPSPPAEQQLMFNDFYISTGEIQRRSLLKWIGAAGAGFLTAMGVSLLRSVGAPPSPSLYDTIWKRGQRLMNIEGKPVSVHALQPGMSMIVFPEESIGSERAQTALIRVNPQYLRLPKSRSDWAPMGYVAYSRVCTHAGCPVGLFEANTYLLLCPCHQSTFDVLTGAQPTGGPAARALPQLPLYIDTDGYLRAGGGFSQAPGPGFWFMPTHD